MLVRMIETIRFASLPITSIVAVIEPASNLAIFVGLTENLDSKEKCRIVVSARRRKYVIFLAQ
jgi:small neutral amino acid transporter SnatA (MarC family)